MSNSSINQTEMGRYIAARRTELGMTQKELADRLHVTNKAVSKWETGRGLPDIQLLEPLSQALDISVATLIGCGRSEPEEATVKEAIAYSARSTRSRIFRWLGWCLLVVGLIVAGGMLPWLLLDLQQLSMEAASIGVIGGADGPTAILVTGNAGFPDWIWYLLPVLLIVGGIVVLLLSRKKK